MNERRRGYNEHTDQCCSHLVHVIAVLRRPSLSPLPSLLSLSFYLKLYFKFNLSITSTIYIYLRIVVVVSRTGHIGMGGNRSVSTSRGRASSAPPSPSLAESPHMPCLKEVKEGRGEREREGEGKREEEGEGERIWRGRKNLDVHPPNSTTSSAVKRGQSPGLRITLSEAREEEERKE